MICRECAGLLDPWTQKETDHVHPHSHTPDAFGMVRPFGTLQHNVTNVHNIHGVIAKRTPGTVYSWVGCVDLVGEESMC